MAIVGGTVCISNEKRRRLSELKHIVKKKTCNSNEQRGTAMPARIIELLSNVALPVELVS